MSKITPFLWYDTQAEEAANFYVGLFPDSKIQSVSRYPAGIPDVEGTVMTVAFELSGQQFTALNAGPMFKFNESVSFVVDCTSQEEVDKYWNALTANGGEESQCGWLKDKYGLSWQICPRQLMDLMQSNDKEKAARVMAAMMKMKKIVIADLEAAAAAGQGKG